MNADPFWTSADLEAEAELGPVVVAGFDGPCSQCPQEIMEGDDIRADGQGGWQHADCDDWMTL